MSSLRTKPHLALVATLASIVRSECFLKITATVCPEIRYRFFRDQGRVLPDPLLGHRPHSLFPEHDARGFRNPSELDRTLVVRLSDSQTYGHKVRHEEAWPRKLDDESGISTYYKELVFAPCVLTAEDEMPELYRKLLRNEQEARRRAVAFCNRHEVPRIDVLPTLRLQLAQGLFPYPVSANGHNNALGHAAVAHALFTRLEQDFTNALDACHAERR